jgi:hypothetical membrane protein
MAERSIRAVGRRSTTAWNAATDLVAGGSLLAVAGAVILLGIISAEALYPGTYSTGTNEISDLGGTRPPNSIVVQPSATIFDGSMLVVGVLITAGAWFVHHAFGRRSVTIPMAVLGIAAFGVGVFPGNTGAPHAICAMVTFVAGGVAAITSARVVSGPFRWLPVTLGTITLAVLVSYLLLGDAHPMSPMGVGGIERWIVYPVVVWVILFGGYLAGRAGDTALAGGARPA